MKAPHLPRELHKLTPEQVEAVIAYYVSLPLDELRWRQERANAEARTAFQASFPGPAHRHHDRRLLINAQITVDLLSEAVGRQTWPEDPHHVIDVARYAN